MAHLKLLNKSSLRSGDLKQSLRSTDLQKGIANVLILVLFLVLAVGLSVYLVQNRTNVVPHANVTDSEEGTMGPGFSLTTSDTAVSENQTFSVIISAQSQNEEANMFAMILEYPKDKVEVLAIQPQGVRDASSSASFVKTWLDQSDDKNGIVKLSGGVPNPGIKTEVGKPLEMARVQFKVIASTGSIEFNTAQESAIYSNTTNKNILESLGGITVPILATPTGVPSTPMPIINPGILGLSPQTQIIGKNCTVPITIDVNTGGRLSHGTDAVIMFDPKVWIVDKTVNGQIYNTYFPYVDNIKGKMMMSGLSLSGFTGQGKLMTLYFKVSPDVVPGTKTQLIYDFDPNDPLKTIDSNLIEQRTVKDILGKVENGTYTIGNTVCAAPSATPMPWDPKRADLFNDTQKPNLVNDQDVSVFYSKCAEEGVELFGKPASVQPICDINNDDTINTPDFAVLLKYRGKTVE